MFAITLRATMILMIMAFMPMASASKPLQTFNVDSYQRILEKYKQQPFLLVLWSLDCPPCMDELKLLGEFHEKNPATRLLLISTDSPTQQVAIVEVMQNFGLAQVEQWVFSDAPTTALRYAIDPAWYGELPRSYFYLADHQRRAVSGRLNWQQLLDWQIAIANSR